MKFGDRLRSLRKEKNLTLRELGKELNISFSALGKYERNENEPDFDTLEKLSKYFDVTIDYLVGGVLDISLESITIKETPNSYIQAPGRVNRTYHDYLIKMFDAETSNFFIEYLNASPEKQKQIRAISSIVLDGRQKGSN